MQTESKNTALLFYGIGGQAAFYMIFISWCLLNTALFLEALFQETWFGYFVVTGYGVVYLVYFSVRCRVNVGRHEMQELIYARVVRVSFGCVS